jgi:hypothetical protein
MQSCISIVFFQNSIRISSQECLIKHKQSPDQVKHLSGSRFPEIIINHGDVIFELQPEFFVWRKLSLIYLSHPEISSLFVQYAE